MLAFPQGDLPHRLLDISSIDDPLQQFRNPGGMHQTILAPVIERLAFEKAFHLDLSLETPRRIAFQGFPDHRDSGFIRHQPLTALAAFLIAVADRRLEHPKAPLDAGLHGFPINTSGAVIPMRQRSHGGEHGHCLLIGPHDLIHYYGSVFESGTPVPLDRLEAMAKRLEPLPQARLAILLENVRRPHADAI